MKTNSIFTSILSVILLCIVSSSAIAQNKTNHIEGRWNMTIHENGNQYASWLELRPWGYAMVGSFLHIGGYPRPLSEIEFGDTHFNFALPWGAKNDTLKVEGKIIDDELQGNIHYSNGKILKWSAVRAPELPYVKNPVWGDSIVLFNGENLDGWHALGKNQWFAESGILKSSKAGSNLASDMEFMDFKLHIEFRYPKHGNSGVYLRGRYEVQIADNIGNYPAIDQLGSIFGFLEPNEIVAKGAGEWQTFDITLIGRRVTVQLNGSTIINDQRLPAITGGALDSNEENPGPFVLQGDHDPIEYRNIIVTPRIAEK